MMNSLILNEPSSTKHILANFNHVIDEAKLIQSINRSKNLAVELKIKNPLSNRLSFIEKDIAHMEAELKKIYDKVF